MRKPEESLQKLAGDVERLAHLAYPDAANDMLEIIVKDQFLDALRGDDLRLRVKQNRPTTGAGPGTGILPNGQSSTQQDCQRSTIGTSIYQNQWGGTIREQDWSGYGPIGEVTAVFAGSYSTLCGGDQFNCNTPRQHYPKQQEERIALLWLW